MSVRSELAQALSEALEGVVVIDHADNPTIAKPTVMVYAERVEHGTTKPLRTYTVTVAVLVPTSDEGLLEDVLEDVLEAVDSWTYPAVWTSAERGVYADSFPAFTITVIGTYQHVIPED